LRSDLLIEIVFLYWFRERQPDFSPNGHLLAYASDDSGHFEIYVCSVEGPPVRKQISTAGGTEPLWARDGSRLYYRRGDEVWGVDIRWEPDFSPGRPRLLFSIPRIVASVNGRSYDISLDGRQFLMVQATPATPTPVTELILVQNWFDELNRLFPE
jgi:eukaryotic-like serine/threonine-protein kinase